MWCSSSGSGSREVSNRLVDGLLGAMPSTLALFDLGESTKWLSRDAGIGWLGLCLCRSSYLRQLFTYDAYSLVESDPT